MSLDYGAIAAEFEPYLGIPATKPFTGSFLERMHRYELDRSNDSLRSVAVAAVDCYHGHTCEFSNSPQSHREEYDILERLLLGEEAPK